MILSITFSKPSNDVEEKLGRAYKKIKISVENASGKTGYFAQMFTEKQVFHQHMDEAEVEAFLEAHAGKTFKNCIERTENQEICLIANKKGKITRLCKEINNDKRKVKVLVSMFGRETPIEVDFSQVTKVV